MKKETVIIHSVRCGKSEKKRKRDGQDQEANQIKSNQIKSI